MFYKIQYSLVNISNPYYYIQYAGHVSNRIDHPLKFSNTNPVLVNAFKYAFFPRIVPLWNRLPRSAVLHVTPSVLAFQAVAIPAISCMQPLHGNVLI